MRIRRIFFWLTIAALGSAALFGIAALLVPSLPYNDKILLTTFLVGVYSLLALVGAVVIERAKRKSERFAGVLCVPLSVGAMGIWIYEIWLTSSWSDFAIRSGASLTCLAAVAAHYGLLAPARLTGTPRFVKITAIASATLLGLLIAAYFWIEPQDDWVFRWTGALAIVAVGTSIATPIAWKIQALRRAEDATPSMHAGVQCGFRCPRCGAQQDVPLGHSKCAQCRLDVTITVREPRCACGYSFLGLRTDVCPECGRAIPDEDRWALVRAD